MALITCPECEQVISDTAESCPHCGYIIENNYKKKTPIGPIHKNPILGLVCITPTILGAIGSFIFKPFGVALFLVSLGILPIGISSLEGTYKASCPHCGKKLILSKTVQYFTCRHCKKAGMRNGDFLEPDDEFDE